MDTVRDRRPRQHPVAVVGVSALMPGPPDVEGFWRTVLEGRDLIADVPPTHWLVEDYYDPDPSAPDKTYGRRGAFLSPVDFDPMALGIPPNTMQATDTTQLLALRVAQQVLTDYGERRLDIVDRERVSVILGTAPLELLYNMASRLQRPVWLKALRESGVPEPEAVAICDRIADHYVPWQEATFPGLLSNVVAGRIANKFDLHGTNFTTDAACASSLAAVSMAVNELALGKADLVITGGVDTLNDIMMYMCFSKTPALSPTGDCRPFSDAADGTMLGEGLAMFALKRLEDAERDEDRIYAVVRGIGTASDGKSTAIYAPLPEGQERALRRSYEAAGYGPETVELVEAHGTGTTAGDAAEFAALRSVFAESGQAGRRWCALGTVKSQIGHTKAAAGAAGLLKAVLSLHHKILPPTIKVEHPNPAMALESSPFYLNTQARPWIRSDDHPRRASVSSFGFGGSNFHATLEEYPEDLAWRQRTMPSELVLLSGADPAELISRARALEVQEKSLSQIARQSQQEFRPADEARLAIVAADTAQLTTKLEQAITRIEKDPDTAMSLPTAVHYATGVADTGRIGFLFPGQGSQYLGMGADVAMHFPEARAVWDHVAACQFDDRALHEVVFAVPVFTDEHREEQERLLTATEWAQPALAVTSLALVEVLRALGIEASCVAGHSFGELVALHHARVVDTETLIRLARRRGELMRDAGSTTPGAMLAVSASREDVETALATCGSQEWWVANHNAPKQVAISGTLEGITEAEKALTAHGFGSTRLNAATAFHSPLVASASEPLLDFLREMEIASPRIDVYSNATADTYPSGPDEIRAQVSSHVASPVRFVDEIEAMYARGVRTFLEVGAGQATSKLVGQILGEREHLALSVDRKGRDGVTSLHDALGRLAVAGLAMNFDVLWAAYAPETQGHERTKSKMTMSISGANFDRPYPPPGGASELPPPNASAAAPAVPSVPARPPAAIEPVAPVVPAVLSEPAVPTPAVAAAGLDAEWLATFQEVQRQTAEAHASYQNAMADSHQSFLRAAESSLNNLAAALGGLAPVPTNLASSTTGPVATAHLTPTMPPAPASTPVPGGPDADPTPDVEQPLRAENVDLEGILLSVVADKTGYPVDMLSGTMELATDLGIDSIKRVEILSALREQAPNLPNVDVTELGKLRSLNDIVAKLNDTVPTSAVSESPVPEALTEHTSTTSAPDLNRQVVRVVPAVPSGLAMAGLDRGPLVVTDEGSGIADEVVARLSEHGIQASVRSTVPGDACGVVFLGGLRDITGEEDALAVDREAFRVARAVASGFEERGCGVFVTVQDTGGDFGLDGREPVRAWLGGVAALARTAAREWPDAGVKAIDCERGGRDATAIAADIVRELLGGGSTLEVGLRADGTRTVPETVESPIDADPASVIGPDSVIVATGGARGVTAAALRALAERCQPRFVLVGRTSLAEVSTELGDVIDENLLKRTVIERERQRTGRPPVPAEVDSIVAEILARQQIRESMAGLEAAGSKVRYVSADIRDARTLTAALEEVRREWGPITGIVHGAGVVADKRIVDKTEEQFERVFHTKVAGLRSLLAVTTDDPIAVVCLFSSVAARYGNVGQCDYAMANEVLNQVACAEASKRPGCLVRSIAWGPWRGGMVSPALAEHFEGRGVPLIPIDAGASAFAAELAESSKDVQVVISPRGVGPLDGSGPREFSAEVQLDSRSHPYLADHEIAGTPVLPLALVLEWFMGAAREQCAPTEALVLRDIDMLRTVSLDRMRNGGHRLVVHCGQTNGSALALRLSADGDMPHYRAAAVKSGEVLSRPAAAWDAPPDLEPLARTEIYDGTVLFHGPRFHSIRALGGVSPSGAAAVVAGSSELTWSGGTWHTDPAAVDGGLQLAVLWAERVLGGACLPMSVGEYRVCRPGLLDSPARCVVRASQVHATRAECDIALMDEDGSPRAELLGVSLVLRPDTAGD